MQAQLRLILALTCLAGSVLLFAQPSEEPLPVPQEEQPADPVELPPGESPEPLPDPQPAAPIEQNIQPAPATNAAPFADRQAELRRRFRTRTNDVAGTNRPTFTFPTLPAPTVSTRRVRPTNIVGTATNPASTGVVTAAAAAATNVTAGAEVRTVPSRIPRPPGTESAVLPVPTIERTGNPIPAGASNAMGQVAASDDPSAAGAEPAANPVAANLSPDEVIPAGAISVQMMPLDQFLDVYSLYSGRTILRPFTLPAPQGFTLKAQTDLTRREVVEAMDGVLALNNITMLPIGEKFVKAVPSNLAGQEGAELYRARGDELPLAEQFITTVVKLKTAKPTEVAPTLQSLAKTPTAVTPIDSNQTLILRDYASNVKRMLEIVEKIDVMPESDFTLEVIPIKYGKVGDIYATMSALISGTGGATGTAGTTAGSFGAAGRGGLGGMGMGGRGMNTFGGGGYGTYGGSRMGGSRYGGSGGYGYNSGGYGGYTPYEVQDGPSSEVRPQQVVPQPAPGTAQGSFQQRLNQIVNRAAGNQETIKILENANIVPDERSNKLLIFANKRDMAMITNIVSKVDVMLAQVLIEAIIMEVSLGDTLNVGVSLYQHPKSLNSGEHRTAGNMGNGLSLPGFMTNSADGFNYWANIGQDFEAAINMLATDNKVNVLSRPRIQTSHAIPGSFFHGETRPYVSGFTDYGLVGSGLSTRSTITQQEIGISLDVVPFITPEGMVVMEIFQNTQSRPGDVTIDGNPIPIIGTRSASSVLTVRNGDVIMLGGFIQEENRNSKSGVPFLKDIPGLGVLFRRKDTEKNRNEVIVLLKATVLETPEEAAFLAESERRQLPGIRQAEREFEENDAKRMKKVQRKEK